MPLKEYRRKRNFKHSPEPAGKRAKHTPTLSFVVQLHHASRIHYDFRLEAEGVLKSWAVPKGPTLDPGQQHLAVMVEDHPIDYGDFEGMIPKGNYGAGTVMVWDKGTYLERNSSGRSDSDAAIQKGIAEGHITFVLTGTKLRGEFALVRLHQGDAKSWLLIKKRDRFARRQKIPGEELSVKTGRTMAEIANQAASKGEVWISKRVGTPKGEREVTPSLAPKAPAVSPTPTGKLSPEKFPRKLKPMIATPWPTSFKETGWVFELDHGGHRAIAEIEKGTVRLHSKYLLSYGGKYPSIVESLKSHKNLSAVLDGEITDQGEYWVSDVLHLNGMNLRHQPLSERKEILTNLDIFDQRIRLSPSLAQPDSLLKKASEQGLPGIIAKHSKSPYTAGTSKQWLCIRTEEKSEETSGPRLTHLKKLYWSKERITKGDLIEYYRTVAPTLIPHLKDRPQSMHRFPDGIGAPGFFHKDLTEHYPKQVKTQRIFSSSSGKSINYLLCQNEFTLLYMANLGCIELNPWLSRVGSLDHPDAIVIDLDPDDGNTMREITEVAQKIRQVLDKIGAPHLCKTSGSTGLHIYIPTQGRYDYTTGRNFAIEVCQVIHQFFPKTTSLERNPAKRRGRIYLDCFQNAEGQTVAAPYSVRPKPGAPVSTPLEWKEVTADLNLHAFNIQTVPDRLKKKGDLWAPTLTETIDLERRLSSLRRSFPIRK